MATITIKGHIYRSQYEWQDEPKYHFSTHDGSDEHCVQLQAHEITVEVPDGLCLPERVGALREGVRKAYLQAEEVTAALNQEINKLLLLSNDPSSNIVEG